MVTSRIWFTAAQKADLWERWKNGQSAAAISRALERKNKTGVERIVVLRGGISGQRRAESPGSTTGLRNAKRFPVALRWASTMPADRPGLGRAPSTVEPGDQAQRRQSGLSCKPADRRARERAVAPKPCRLALYSGATIARGAEARAAMVAAADLRLAEAGVPDPPRRADISRSDGSQPLHPDPRRAEKGAVGRSYVLRGGCVTPRATTRRVDRGVSSISVLYPRAARRDRGSRSAGALGRRPSYQSERHAAIATLVGARCRLNDAHRDPPQGHDDCCCSRLSSASASCLRSCDAP